MSGRRQPVLHNPTMGSWCQLMHVDELRGEVDASLLTKRTSIGPIDYSKAGLVSIGSLWQQGTYEKMGM
jgi:hypothetical protein